MNIVQISQNLFWKGKSLENRDELIWEWMKFFVFASSSLELSVSLWMGQKAEKRKIFDALLLLLFYRPQNLFCSNKQPLNLFWAREVKTLKKQSTKKWVTILRLWLKNKSHDFWRRSRVLAGWIDPLWTICVIQVKMSTWNNRSRSNFVWKMNAHNEFPGTLKGNFNRPSGLISYCSRSLTSFNRSWTPHWNLSLAWFHEA